MKKLLLLIFLTSVLNNVSAQPYKTIKGYVPYKWMVGLSWSVIEDDGRPFQGIFNVGSSWNILAYPSKISLDRHLKYGWSVEASATYSQYKGAKVIQNTTGLSSTFLCVDINGKYSFYTSYAPSARWIEPYLTFGVGYTYRSSALASPHIPTLNLGLGINFWLIQDFGIRLHSNAKFALYPTILNTPGNYLQHSAGLVYRFHEGGKSNNPSDKKRYPWTKDNKRYKENKGGH